MRTEAFGSPRVGVLGSRMSARRPEAIAEAITRKGARQLFNPPRKTVLVTKSISSKSSLSPSQRAAAGPAGSVDLGGGRCYDAPTTPDGLQGHAESPPD